MSKLKLCPFCGSEAELVDLRLSWCVKCTNEECSCTVTGNRAPEPNCEKPQEYWDKFEQSAITKWNRRSNGN